MIIVNAGLAGGLIVSYFRGAPPWIIAICGIFLFAFANAIMIFKLRQSRVRGNNSN
jgi:hypothetical protein